MGCGEASQQDTVARLPLPPRHCSPSLHPGAAKQLSRSLLQSPHEHVPSTHQASAERDIPLESTCFYSLGVEIPIIKLQHGGLGKWGASNTWETG